MKSEEIKCGAGTSLYWRLTGARAWSAFPPPSALKVKGGHAHKGKIACILFIYVRLVCDMANVGTLVVPPPN